MYFFNSDLYLTDSLFRNQNKLIPILYYNPQKRPTRFRGFLLFFIRLYNVQGTCSLVRYFWLRSRYADFAELQFSQLGNNVFKI